MSTKPEALRLADELLIAQPEDLLETELVDEAAAELRRLQAERDELLDALKKCSEQLTRLGYSANHADQAIAAIAKVTGEQA